MSPRRRTLIALAVFTLVPAVAACDRRPATSPHAAVVNGFGGDSTSSPQEPAVPSAPAEPPPTPTVEQPPPTAPSAPSPVPATASSWTAEENAKPGDTDWHVPDDPRVWDKVRGFASTTSVNSGESFTLFVSTRASSWHVDAYRIGWYGGARARRIWSSEPRPGVVQPGPVVDRSTHMAEAPWQPSLDVDTGGWPQGMYMLLLRSDDGGESYVPMVVRDDAATAPLLVQSSVTTWQAYNGWGNANLYTGGWPPDPAKRATVVSFDRPYDGNGSGEFFGREFEFVQFVERLGIDVTYWTDVDLHLRPELALHHKAVVSLAHDEYYSPAMRAGLETARDAGVNVLFLGANEVYRKIRFEPSRLGDARHEVNYRSTADPVSRKNPDDATVEWRVAPSRRPESALVGNFYECNPVNADWVVADDSSWVFDGTGLHNGDRVRNMVGNEYDRVTPDVPTPRNIQVLASSPVSCRGKSSVSDTTYYTARSGAAVFSAGTMRMVTPLLPACENGPDTGPIECRVQRLVENVLRAFAAGPAGIDHPAVSNVGRFGITLRHPTDP